MTGLNAAAAGNSDPLNRCWLQSCMAPLANIILGQNLELDVYSLDIRQKAPNYFCSVRNEVKLYFIRLYILSSVLNDPLWPRILSLLLCLFFFLEDRTGKHSRRMMNAAPTKISLRLRTRKDQEESI